MVMMMKPQVVNLTYEFYDTTHQPTPSASAKPMCPPSRIVQYQFLTGLLTADNAHANEWPNTAVLVTMIASKVSNLLQLLSQVL